MKRRNEMDIIADVLKVARGGARKTRIVYGANLNFKIVKRYLSGLLERRLLVCRDEIYGTTEAGLVFLERYYDLTSVLNGSCTTLDQTCEGTNIVQE